jgi:hypothetical protein
MVKAPTEKRRGRPRVAVGGGVGKTLVFRPEVEVRTSVERAAAATGNTLSAEINSGLRRVFWKEEVYAAEQQRIFGSQYGHALAYLLARLLSGIEHEMQASARESEAVRMQVDAAYQCVLQAVMAQWRGKPAMLLSPQAARELMQGDTVEYVPLGLFGGESAARLPWQRVVLAIHKNLTESANELWWPLSDRPVGGKIGRVVEPPLRPSIAALREVWPVDIILR